MATLREDTKKKSKEKQVIAETSRYDAPNIEIPQTLLHERAALQEKAKKQAAAMGKTTKKIAEIEKQVEASLRAGLGVEQGPIRALIVTKPTRKSVSWKNEFIAAVSLDAADEIKANAPTGSKEVLVIEVNPEYKSG